MKATNSDSSLAHEEFGPFEGRVWLNSAHQGPLPRTAVDAAVTAAQMKAAPHRIHDEEFGQVPERLRSLLAELVGGDVEEIVLGNSTSHGLHLIANGLELRPGDEVLLIKGDHPATLLPWLRLVDLGVRVRWLQPEGGALTAAELASAITPRTRVLALTWVNSFTGHVADLHALGQVCRQAGVLSVVNASQGIGALPLDVVNTPVDAVVSCGYKWLCGPYGTGFTWLHPDLMSRLRPQQAYWLAMQSGGALDKMRETGLRDDLGVRAFDVFCPANFLNALPWIAAIELILHCDVDAIAAHNDRLVNQLLVGLNRQRYWEISPTAGASRSSLVVVERIDGTAADRYKQLTAAGVDIALREGNLRLCPHLFNTAADIDRALNALDT